MAINRGGKAAIIQHWVGIFAGVGFVAAAAYGGYDYVVVNGTADPVSLGMAAIKFGLIFGIGIGAAIGLVFGGIIAVTGG